MARPKRYTSNLTSFFFHNSEADTEIASLAYVWNCPVLSNDSDFFIFDIKAGYIPFEFLEWNSSSLTASVFYRQKLASHHRIRAELIPLWASLAGNDYVSRDLSSTFNRALNGFQTFNHIIITILDLKALRTAIQTSRLKRGRGFEMCLENNEVS